MADTDLAQAIQARSANSLVKIGSSERYKDRTQSLLDLLDDEGIIWGKVLPAGNHPGELHRSQLRRLADRQCS